MILSRRLVRLILAATVLGLCAGCAMWPGNHLQSESAECQASFLRPEADRIEVYFFRQASYSGLGRIHVLKLDGRRVGELTADNYYKLTLWPGQYFFTVFLPEEDFLGQTSPPMTIGEQVTFLPADCGSIFTYQYTDGLGTGGFKLSRAKTRPGLLSDRTLAGDLGVRDTAQVTEYFGTRYDGPAAYKRPHGLGTLTFSDGSQYRGIFEHGRATNRARFYFSNGTVFMGVFHRGRPQSPGILMTPCGNILFAGRFIDEQPHGVGLRNGKEFPEFCVYDHGRDVTKSFRRLAREILDVEDQARIDAFTLQSSSDSLPSDQPNSAPGPAMTDEDPGPGDLKIESVESPQTGSLHHLQIQTPDNQADAIQARRQLIEELRRTRFERELAKVMELKEDHRARVEEERSWCQEEFALGRRLCQCAAFAADLDDWEECTEPFESEHSY